MRKLRVYKILRIVSVIILLIAFIPALVTTNIHIVQELLGSYDVAHATTQPAGGNFSYFQPIILTGSPYGNVTCPVFTIPVSRSENPVNFGSDIIDSNEYNYSQILTFREQNGTSLSRQGEPVADSGTFYITDTNDDTQRRDTDCDGSWEYFTTGTAGAPNIGNLLYLGHNYCYQTSYRFSNVAIPHGATITSAAMYFKASGSTSADTVRTIIVGTDLSYPSAPTSASDTAWTSDLTDATETWDFTTNWVVGNWYNTFTHGGIDLKGIVQEIVDRASWQSGNYLQMFVKNDVSTSNAYRLPSDYSHAAADATYLTVNWTYTPEGDPGAAVDIYLDTASWIDLGYSTLTGNETRFTYANGTLIDYELVSGWNTDKTNFKVLINMEPYEEMDIDVWFDPDLTEVSSDSQELDADCYGSCPSVVVPYIPPDEDCIYLNNTTANVYTDIDFVFANGTELYNWLVHQTEYSSYGKYVEFEVLYPYLLEANATEVIYLAWGDPDWNDPNGYRNADEVYANGEYYDFESATGWTTPTGTWSLYETSRPTWLGGEYKFSRDPNVQAVGDDYVMVAIQGSSWNDFWRTPLQTVTNTASDFQHWETYGRMYITGNITSYMSTLMELPPVTWTPINTGSGEIMRLANTTTLYSWQNCPNILVTSDEETMCNLFAMDWVLIYDDGNKTGLEKGEHTFLFYTCNTGDLGYMYGNETVSCDMTLYDHGSALIDEATYVENFAVAYNSYDEKWYFFGSYGGIDPVPQAIHLWTIDDADFDYDMTASDVTYVGEITGYKYDWNNYCGTPRPLVHEDNSLELFFYGMSYEATDRKDNDNFIGQAYASSTDWTSYTSRNVGNEYYQSGTAASTMAYTAGNYTDFILTADIGLKYDDTAAQCQYASLNFDIQDTDNYYRVILNNADDIIGLQKVVGGSPSNLASAVDMEPHLEAGHMVGVRVTSYNGNITVQYNNYGDRWIDSFNLVDSTFTYGAIGLGTYGSRAYFDNVRVNTWLPEIFIDQAGTVLTDDPTGLDCKDGTLNGNIISSGASGISLRGFVYDTTSHESPDNDVAPDVSAYASYTNETGSFTLGIYAMPVHDLTPNVTNYVRAVIGYGGIYSYGEEITCSPETDIGNTPISYDFGLVEESSTYATGTDYFTIINNGNCTIDITISAGNMTGGLQWTLSDTCTPGSMIFGLRAGVGS